MEVLEKQIFEKLDNGEIQLNGSGFMPTVEDIREGAFDKRPVRAMVIDYTPGTNMISGITDQNTYPGTIVNYVDQNGDSIKIQLEYMCFGILYNVPKGCLVQFSIVE